MPDSGRSSGGERSQRAASAGDGPRASILQTRASSATSGVPFAKEKAPSATARHKIPAAVHTTGKSKAVVTRSERESTRFHLCMDALSQGCIQSYIHLYHLSHRAPVCVDELSQTFFSIPEERLKWVFERLCSVEVLRQQSEFREAFSKCVELAEYFENERDMVEATWHYETALRYAMESLDTVLLRDVRYAFGQFYERIGRLRAACDMYGAIYDCACALKQVDVSKATCADLVRVFQLLGDEAKPIDPHQSKIFYDRSLRFAHQSESGTQEVLAYKALGEINEQMNHLSTALKYNKQWGEVAHQEQMRSDECSAALKTASLEERLDMNQASKKSLETANRLANELEDDAKVCRAMMQLGEVYRSENKSEDAMQCFKESFAAARRSGVQSLIDSSRVAMGFAIGEYYFTSAGNNRGYLPIVCDDIKTQLHWMSTGEL